MRAIVIGGGLAGLAAALRLAERGSDVTLLEARPRLGGATHSFTRNGLSVDNGQHVFLRCYTEYLRFLRDIGAGDRVEVQRRFDIPVRTPRSGARLYRTGGLPAPLHLGACLARYGVLSWRDRIRVARAVLRLRGLDEQDSALDERSFGDWLAEHGQSAASIAALWDMLIVAALNTTSDQASLRLATKVFQTALLTSAPAADIGIPLVPLEELHARPAATRLADLGARIHLRAKATAITSNPKGFTVSTEDGPLEGDVVVLATPNRQATSLMPEVPELGTAPIVNAHLVFDRAVTDLPFVAAVDSPVQWTFDRTRNAGLADGQYLAVSLSAAQHYIDQPTAQLRDALLPEFTRLFPAARDARLVDFFVTRERHATFRQSPGSGALRPPAVTRTPGLFLAGAWTDTGWPDTMEGAVRSGNEVAGRAFVYSGRYV